MTVVSLVFIERVGWERGLETALRVLPFEDDEHVEAVPCCSAVTKLAKDLRVNI